MQPAEAGQILVAVPGKLDPNFDATVVYLFDVSNGAAGLVLNRPTDIPVSDVIPELSAVVAEPTVVFHGGPIAIDHGLVLAVTDGGINVVDTAEAADAAPESIRLFAGHSGWEEGQLEDEITSGDWFVLVGATDDILTPDPLGLWRAVFARQTGELRRYRSYPNDPGLN